jgi:hypothetical protein
MPGMILRGLPNQLTDCSGVTKRILEQQWLIYPTGSKESGLGVEYRMEIEYRE